MTLAVAWFNNKGVYLASDSRISKADRFSDYGIKVTPLHIRVFSPSEQGKEPKIAFDKTYGMCFSGDFAGAAVIRNFLSITMQRLQFVPTFSEVSFSNICKVISKFYFEISQKLQEEIENESIDFFLAGLCPKNKKIMLAKFYIEHDFDKDQSAPKYEILDYESDNTPIYFVGSGEGKYPLHLDIHKGVPLTTRPIVALKSLITSKGVPSVGGHVQVGSFEKSGNFYMLGTKEDLLDEHGRIKSIGYYYAGIDMNDDVFEVDNGGFIVMGQYIDL